MTQYANGVYVVMTELHTVVETPAYLSDARHCKISEAERSAIVNAVAGDPDGGDLVKNTGGVRKVRVAARGKGKSGGYRIITVYISNDIPVYLLAMLSKGERANFSDADKKAFRQLSAEIKEMWKERQNG